MKFFPWTKFPWTVTPKNLVCSEVLVGVVVWLHESRSLKGWSIHAILRAVTGHNRWLCKRLSVTAWPHCWTAGDLVTVANLLWLHNFLCRIWETTVSHTCIHCIRGHSQRSRLYVRYWLESPPLVTPVCTTVTAAATHLTPYTKWHCYTFLHTLLAKCTCSQWSTPEN